MANTIVAISLAALALGAVAGVSMAIYVFASKLLSKGSSKSEHQF